MARLETVRKSGLFALIQAIGSLLAEPTDARRDAVESAIDGALESLAGH